MSIHPLVLATLENLRTHAELQAEILRSRRESATTASTSGQSHAMTIGRRLREADAIAGSWLRVLAAVTETAAPSGTVTETVEPHEHVWVTALDGDTGEPARDADGNTWTHCGVCTVLAPKRRTAAADAPVPDPLVCEVAWHTHLETPVTEECVRSVPEPTPAPPGKDRVVGYRLGKRLRCVQHPFASMRDTAVTAQELPDGGFCDVIDCGRDLLA